MAAILEEQDLDFHDNARPSYKCYRFSGNEDCLLVFFFKPARTKNNIFKLYRSQKHL
jgi:hypothetical protein